MKKSLRILAAVMAVLMLCLCLASCGKKLSGTYVSEDSDALKLVIQLIDIRTGPTDDDILMINWLIDAGVPFTVVATKTDKLSKSQLAQTLKQLHEQYFLGTDIEILPFSSVTREGKDVLWNKILAAIG